MGLFYLHSCSSDSISSPIDSSTLLNQIEENVFRDNYSKNTKDNIIENKSFFNELDYLKSIENEKERKEKSDLFIKSLKGEGNYKSTEDISKTEKEIYIKFFALTNENKKNSIFIANYFISEIEKSNINIEDKNLLIEKLVFIKDLYVYIQYNIEENYDNSDIQLKLSGCAYRGCLDCCMYKEAKALSESNWVKKAAFLLTAAESTALWAVSCGWDCLTN